MNWQEFDTSSALERNVLERALPLVATESTGTWRATINMTGAAPQTFVQAGLASTLGPTPAGCIDLLQIRPLLFGTAWKVLDLLLEAALATAGETPDLNNGRWSIGGKAGKAGALVDRPAALNPLLWEALTLTYVKTVEVRHSLVHRSVFTDSSGSLVGHDRRGDPVRPVTSVEQEALGRAALRASQLVLAAASDERVEADLTRQLGQLVAIHELGLPSVKPYDALPEMTVIIGVDPAAPARYRLDVPTLRARSPWPDAVYVDLVVQPQNRQGQELRGRLEHAPNEVVSIDPAAPPSWLS